LENVIFRGDFNVIYKANLTYFHLHPDRSNEIVAVKKICETVDDFYFKAALTDLKGLAQTTNLQHSNVVNFIGACSSKIRSSRHFSNSSINLPKVYYTTVIILHYF